MFLSLLSTIPPQLQQAIMPVGNAFPHDGHFIKFISFTNNKNHHKTLKSIHKHTTKHINTKPNFKPFEKKTPLNVEINQLCHTKPRHSPTQNNIKPYFAYKNQFKKNNKLSITKIHANNPT